MEPTTFFEHYRICTSEAGREVSRTGAAINYKAIDTRSGDPVRLQLIPLATIEPEKLAQLKERAETAEKLDHVNIAKTFAVGVEHDYFALVSEHFAGETDCRSEMYSLGATMCFLLTGAAPIAVSGMKARLRIRRLPELRRAPKPLRNLLVYLLREDPNNRPQDPVALEKEMRDCLTKIERRQAIGRKLGLSLAAVVPRKAKQSKQAASPLAQVLRGFAAVVVLLLAAAAAAEYFFPDKIPYFGRSDKVGVQIGVPDAAKFAQTPNEPPSDAVDPNQSKQNASPEIANTNQNSPSNVGQTQTTTAPSITPAIATNTQTAAVAQQAEPPSPALGPSEPPAATAPENSEQSSMAESTESSTRERTKPRASSRRSTSES